ncbi:MAG: putative glycosyltransferase [Paracoccaceae bacterium]|jgi:predicted glycosyltransferase
MHALVEIVHPADVLFFVRPIRILQARGHRISVVSRRKDVACDLLDRFGIAHDPISSQGTGLLGLGAELLRRNAALLSRIRHDRPDVMLGFGGVAISQVGRLTGIPSLVIYDSENAHLQTRLAWPFLTRLIVPEDYAGPLPRGRAERLPGIKDLSYFHPGAFRPDRNAALALGLDPARPNLFVRTVRWGANHDIGKSGWSNAEAEAFVAALSPRAKLHVSAEGEAPPALRPHIWQGDPAQVHHLLGCCDAYAGESSTMACEAATMGVPALYAGVDLPGYVAGMDRRGLVRWVAPDARATLAAQAATLLEDRAGFDAARSVWLATLPDWAVAVADRAEALAR